MREKRFFPHLKLEEFFSAIDRFQKAQLLVIGDVGLDEYILGQVHRISPEAPVPILEIDKRQFSLGLAANVAQNIASLGGQVQLIGVTGEDRSSSKLKSLLHQARIKSDSLLLDPTRQTTCKTRVLAQQQYLIRIDDECTNPLSPFLEVEILKKVREQISFCHGVILEDYAKGSLSQNIIKEIIKISQAHGKKVILDPHRNTPFQFYQDVDVLKPNLEEALILSGLNHEYKHILKDAYTNEEESKEQKLKEKKNKNKKRICHQAGEKLLKELNLQHVIITQGEEGMSLFSQEKKESFMIPSLFPRSVFDVTGAGDTALATIGLGWFSGLSLQDSCFLANLASSYVVEKMGAVSCDHKKLKHSLSSVFQSKSPQT